VARLALRVTMYHEAFEVGAGRSDEGIWIFFLISILRFAGGAAADRTDDAADVGGTTDALEDI
jgi:hypothetical protein